MCTEGYRVGHNVCVRVFACVIVCTGVCLILHLRFFMIMSE